MKALWAIVGSIIVSCFIWASVGHCQECKTPEYSFNQKDSNEIVLSIEKLQKYKEVIILQDDVIKKLKAEIELHKKNTETLKEALSIQGKRIENLEKIVAQMKEIQTERDKMWMDKVEDAKPTLKRDVGIFSGGLAVGGLAALLLILLL